MNKRPLIAFFIVIALGVFIAILAVKTSKKVSTPTQEPLETVSSTDTKNSAQPITTCYSYSKKAPSGLVDREWVKLVTTGEQVTGEYQYLPAEKDSKKGTFNGGINLIDPASLMRLANVFWESQAEGVTVTEQLNIQFNDKIAVALFGEMVDRGDGTYIYKDRTKTTPGSVMLMIDCAKLDTAA